MLCVYFFFFFKQKTAYEMLRSLVGSEMCIRDRYWGQRKGTEAMMIKTERTRNDRVYTDPRINMLGERVERVWEDPLLNPRKTYR